MQIIESTVFGVRSAFYRLRGPDAQPTFHLFPMIHVADPDFYAEVTRRLEDCDLILYEGVKSPTTSLLTASYRFFAESPRLGLVLQHSMKLTHLRDRLVHADVSGEEFETRWSQLALWLRLLVPLAAPVYGYYMRYFATRSDVARHLGMNLRKSRDEILTDDWMDDLADVLVTWRDRRLLDVIEQERLRPENRGAAIAVVYGASHMRAVLKHLVVEQGYRVEEAEWATVFRL